MENIKDIGLYINADDHFEGNRENRKIKIHEKAHEKRAKIQNFSSLEIEGAKNAVSETLKHIKYKCPALFGEDPERIYAHIDLDSFFASVEMLSKPELRNVPMAVGSELMLSTSNYEARKYGIKAGMPGYIAKQLCPALVIVKSNYEKYTYYSEKVMEVLCTYVPETEIYGIDEACLVFDPKTLSNSYYVYNTNVKHGRIKGWEEISEKDFGFDAVFEIIELIREAVYKATGLTVSAGISVCRGLAKFSCGVNKPNGCFVLDKNFDETLLNLDVNKLNGIGSATKELLEKTLGITKVKDLRENLHFVYLLFKNKTFTNIMSLSYGLSFHDSSRVRTAKNYTEKSKGISRTFKPTDDVAEIMYYIWNICSTLSHKMLNSNVHGTLVTLLIKYSRFNTITARKKPQKPISQVIDIFENVISILESSFSNTERGFGRKKIFFIDKIRLIGVSLSNLVKAESVNLIENFKSKGVTYNARNCPICEKSFFHESKNTFETHVNICLNKQELEKKKRKNTLDIYFSVNS